MTESPEMPLCVRLSPDEFRWLSEQSSPMHLDTDEQISADGGLADNFYVLLHGELRVLQQGDREERVLSCGQDQDPLLIGTPFLATVRALRPSRLLKIGAEEYLRQVSATSSANHLLVSGLVWRLRTAESRLHQNEKMAALGQMSAGLNHELNNPAAAGQRAAGQLREALRRLHDLTLELNEQDLTPSQIERLSALQQQAVDRTATASLDPLALSDQEEELGTWLQERGVEAAWELAPGLVSGGLTLPQIKAMAGSLPLAALESALGWLGGVVAVGNLLDVVEQSTARISELVAAVKSYTYMDRSSLQEVDVHDGLNSTLVILGHKLQDIDVRREYAAGLPHVTAYGGELNQVWTNLLDNAADALGDAGHIWVRTRQERDHVVVEIADDGPGIPEEARPYLFKTFYTTKKPGMGTGMGLNLVYQIVVQRHGGDVQVESRPGDTRFRVYLPIEQNSNEQNSNRPAR